MHLQSLPRQLAVFGRSLGLAFNRWLNRKNQKNSNFKFCLPLNNSNTAEIIQKFIAYKTRIRVLEYEMSVRALKRNHRTRGLSEEAFTVKIIPPD